MLQDNLLLQHSYQTNQSLSTLHIRITISVLSDDFNNAMVFYMTSRYFTLNTLKYLRPILSVVVTTDSLSNFANHRYQLPYSGSLTGLLIYSASLLQTQTHCLLLQSLHFVQPKLAPLNVFLRSPLQSVQTSLRRHRRVSSTFCLELVFRSIALQTFNCFLVNS